MGGRGKSHIKVSAVHVVLPEAVTSKSCDRDLLDLKYETDLSCWNSKYLIKQ